jgi:tetratricopeptide (TPR) repeat protein
MLPMGFVLRAFSEALAGLHHAHEARSEDGAPLGVVHRDFNPDNISVTYDGRVKVLDFGIAKSQSAASSTEPGTLKGKYFYMSPEMVLGNPLDRRADIFATGVALYELLCDKRPFEGDTPNAILSGIAYGTPMAPRSLNPAIPAELENLINRCMARSPNERPPTALAVKDELDQIAPRLGAFGTAEVSQLMELLFPPGDAERARIAELRKIDPSLPSQALIPVTPEAVTPVGKKSPQAPGPLDKTARPRPPRKPLPVKKIGFAVGGVAAAALLGVGAWKVLPLLRKPPDAAEARLEELQKAFEAHPDDAIAGDRYADELVAQGQEDEAETVVDKVLAARDDARAHVIKGDLLAKRRFGQKALDEYAKALKQNPKDATALAHAGRLHLARGEVPEARTAMAQALALRPGDRALSLEVAELQARGGDWSSAQSTLTAALARAPRDADLRTMLGLTYFYLKDNTRALSELLSAEKIRPDAPKTELYLGFVYYAESNTKKAIESYRAAIAHSTAPADVAQAHNALGELLLKESDPAGAKKEYAEALKADPKNADATAALKNLP